MADANSIRIVYIFEACARLGCSSEIQALAAHIYHRFFRIKTDMSQYELYTFGSACILLAHRFYEQPVAPEDLAIVASSIVHEPGYNLDSQTKVKLASTIDFVSLVIAVNTNFELSFKDERMMTPGDLLKSIRAQNPELVELDDSISVESDDEIESDDEDADFLLTNNSRHMISGHRYLAHYLYSIKLLMNPSASSSSVSRQFNRLCQVAWIFLTDFHWSPAVMCHPASHIACACLMMAIETCGKSSKATDEPAAEFQRLLNKKWNLILCDDLSSENLARAIHTIMNHYIQFEQIFRKELTKNVIEP